jgi:hypothetical protein
MLIFKVLEPPHKLKKQIIKKQKDVLKTQMGKKSNSITRAKRQKNDLSGDIRQNKPVSGRTVPPTPSLFHTVRFSFLTKHETQSWSYPDMPGTKRFPSS